ncbi:uncharacterized protein HELO_4289B [Halomonas elongata DSM 2581]|uniref:Uncharacterized protein n=1 Tax=Halomonas elongata (strain ATCC 33173 / DSM 2581 / NBRC 15536 / NCIMB 2198 / 1H9) TaxID=768066 RepID=A0A1R4A4K3_HALED|nr:uncharacterized protein HELO_4289B [Halomonas elongata DSM 2581]
MSILTLRPRECGDRLLEHKREQEEYGSSPRVRGPAQGDAWHQGGARFIPAGAGTGPSVATCFASGKSPMEFPPAILLIS